MISGTPNAVIPYNVQMNYGKEFPMAASGGGTWTQYGDWFYTTYMTGGRHTQIFYNNRGSGYSLALPVLNTYVPEYVVNGAIQKYGLNLYSITTIKAADGTNAYQFNLIDRGQSKYEWLDSSGATALNIYRTEEVTDTMNTTSTNAAMDAQNGTNATGNSNATNMNNSSDTNATMTNDANATGNSKMKTKTQMKSADSTGSKMKMNEKAKAKTSGTSGNDQQQNHKQQ
jgi:hypothetical protein